MDSSRITSLLTSLTKNLVSIPLVTNGFEETKAYPYTTSASEVDEYEYLDDLVCALRNMKHSQTPIYKSRTIETKIAQKPNKKDEVIGKPIQSLLFALMCSDNPVLSVSVQTSSQLERQANIFYQRIREYLVNSPIKSFKLNPFPTMTIKPTKEQVLVVLDASMKDKSPIEEHVLELILQVSVKVLQHNIVILFDNKQVVMNIIENEEFKTIVVNTKLIGETFVYNLEDIMKKEDVKLHIMQITITYLKNDANLQEKLKSMCVKNLRQLAQDIGIDIVNSETEKQYTKGELKNLIETKLELSV